MHSEGFSSIIRDNNKIFHTEQTLNKMTEIHSSHLFVASVKQTQTKKQ